MIILSHILTAALFAYIGYRLRGNPYKIDKAHNERMRNAYYQAWVDQFTTSPSQTTVGPDGINVND